jgi:hypothetical protein
LVKKRLVAERYNKQIEELFTCPVSKMSDKLSGIYGYPIMIFMRKQIKFSEKLKTSVAKLRVVLGVSGDETTADLPLFDLIYNSLKLNKFSSPYCTGLLQPEISSMCSSLRNFHTYWFDAKSFD